MSIDAGGLAHMTYNTNNTNYHVNGFPSGGLGVPGSGFGGRGPRLNPKRLSVALPPTVAPISEDSVDNPTPRTSRSHLLAGLRTQPKTPAVPASAPYHQTQHNVQGLGASRWANQGHGGYMHGVPQTATGVGFDLSNQYAVNAGRQMYSLPEQVMAPPTFYEQVEEMDPNIMQQMQMQHHFLARRTQQLQQQLAIVTAAAQGLDMNGSAQRSQYMQSPMTPQTPQNYYSQQQQMQSPIEVPGQPGVYLVYNHATNGYTYAIDPNMQQTHQVVSPVQQGQMGPFSPVKYEPYAPSVSVSPPATERPTPTNMRSFTPPKKAASPPSALEHVVPLPPPSATAFRRGHKKANSLAIFAGANVAEGPKTSSMATFGSQRAVFPPTPMTGTFGPGAARAGDHPVRQPRGPPPLEELTVAPTSKHDGSKNFATRQRRAALDSLMRAGTQRRGISRSSGGSPVSEGGEYNFPIPEESEDVVSVASSGSRKMSPIGSEMKEKRGSSGSHDGYFSLSSASSTSETEDTGMFEQPPTPASATPVSMPDRKSFLNVLNAAEKRKSCAA